MLFAIKHILHVLALPPFSLVALAGLGLYLSRRRPRSGGALVAAGLVLLAVLSMPVVGVCLANLAQSEPALDLDHPPVADAVAVLGGGTNRRAAEYGDTPSPSATTLARVVYAAHVARRLKLPILVTGSRYEAAGMVAALRRDFGTDARWVDDSATDTYDNAEHSASLLRAAGLHRVIVVTDAFHAARATAEFRAAGLVAFAGPTQFTRRLADLQASPDRGLLPSIEGLDYSEAALRELLGSSVRPAMAAVHRLVAAPRQP